MRHSIGLRACLISGLCLLLTGTAATALGTGTAGAALDTAKASVRPGPPELVIGADRDGGRVRLILGQTLEVRLDGNPTTGYTWDVARVDPRVLRRDGGVTYTPAPLPHPRVGSGGTFAARFTAVRRGETTLTLVYHRRFEAGSPARTFTAHITVCHRGLPPWLHID